MNDLKDIISRIRSGDREAFHDLYRIYYPRIHSFIGRRHRAGSDLAGDITQEVFFRLWVNRARLDESASFDSYIHTIAKNILTDIHRRNMIAAGHIERMRTEGATPSNDEALRELDFHDMQRLIDEAVESMPPKQRQIFRLSRRDELLNEEIASLLGISKRTVEKHISNSLRTIKTIVKNSYLLIFA